MSRAAFDWDDANAGHVALHKVSRHEAEEVLAGAPLPIGSEERGGEERHIELGETAKNRLLIVVWTWRHGKIRVVTAFPANRPWRSLWRRLKEGTQNAQKETRGSAE